MKRPWRQLVRVRNGREYPRYVSTFGARVGDRWRKVVAKVLMKKEAER